MTGAIRCLRLPQLVFEPCLNLELSLRAEGTIYVIVKVNDGLPLGDLYRKKEGHV